MRWLKAGDRPKLGGEVCNQAPCQPCLLFSTRLAPCPLTTDAMPTYTRRCFASTTILLLYSGLVCGTCRSRRSRFASINGRSLFAPHSSFRRKQRVAITLRRLQQLQRAIGDYQPDRDNTMTARWEREVGGCGGPRLSYRAPWPFRNALL